ncbi:MAG: hypothetical protein ACXWUU_03630 [Burkholderiales bacterium]
MFLQIAPVDSGPNRPRRSHRRWRVWPRLSRLKRKQMMVCALIYGLIAVVGLKLF